MKKIFILCSLALILILPIATQAQETASECNLVSLFGGWARATAEGQPNGAVFGYLVNLSQEHDSLISASSPVAEVVEFHEMIMGDDDVMRMQPVEGGFAVMPHNYLALQPGGYHIMLINLTQMLEAGTSFELTLVFEQAGAVTLSIPVRAIDAMEEGMGMQMEMPMHAEMTPEATAEAVIYPEACAKLHVLGAWARPAGAGMPNSAAYALLLNLTNQDMRLISASSEVAAAVELHEMTMGDGDVMQMRPIEGGILIPAGGLAVLQPGGLHVMLIGLTQELIADNTMALSLSFEDGTVIELEVPIHEPMESAMPMNH